MAQGASKIELLLMIPLMHKKERIEKKNKVGRLAGWSWDLAC